MAVGYNSNTLEEKKQTPQKNQSNQQQSIHSEIGTEKEVNGIKMKITEVNFVEDDTVSEGERLL
ncbi:hypothetical protein COI69_29720 [Bacillus cereus]|uniref:Uncharacterized protein n=1 Tax=Bacillus cereus TaxID=1396 RepID=A0A9X7HJR6_BACCE|nr:hypothetical protein [Bacillus cereus]PHA08065.1 hypothetical protein COE70_31995 [Bacillus cereus]PHG74542.1 hypothetical protein COI69_29720 [Bacillus cereus]HDR4539324.1 hypothetical protein [Bacillus cereus]